MQRNGPVMQPSLTTARWSLAIFIYKWIPLFVGLINTVGTNENMNHATQLVGLAQVVRGLLSTYHVTGPLEADHIRLRYDGLALCSRSLFSSDQVTFDASRMPSKSCMSHLSYYKLHGKPNDKPNYKSNYKSYYEWHRETYCEIHNVNHIPSDPPSCSLMKLVIRARSCHQLEPFEW